MKKIVLVLFVLFLSFSCFSQSRYISKTVKKIVYSRDGGICKCCGSSLSLEYDHIVPFSCGGSSVASNIQLLCQKCNRSKSNSCFCKVHDKKVGIDCCDGSATSRNSSKATATSTSSSSTSSQCTGTTKKGLRCKKRTTSSSGRCYLHD
jgi:hypothetical protein